MTSLARSFFITGGTSGIGAATARAAASAGHRVYVTGRSRERLDAMLDGGGVGAGTITGAIADVRDWVSLQAAVADAVAALGGLDVAFANAGIGADGDLLSGDPERWSEMVMTNVLGVALTIKATLPALIQSRGRLVLTGSVTGRKAMPGSLYGATKWAVTALGESVRQQVREQGVGVTVIEPGIVDTGFWPSRAAWPHPETLADDDVAATVLWAIAQPDHVDVNEVLVRVKGQPG
ncbi:MAG: SDR family NAD(P)-dependent oxidoreductase [Solirubrobacteraceae bacterium]